MEFDQVHVSDDRSNSLELNGRVPENLQPTEVNVAAIAEHMAEVFFALDSTGCCTYANPQAEALFGIRRAAFVHKRLEEIFQVDAASQLYQQSQYARLHQTSAAFEEFFPSLKRWFAVRLFPSAGGLLAYLQDITEQKETEAALRKEQEFLNVLLDNVQAGIVACDAEGRIKLFNRTARWFHGIPEQPLPPEQWADQYDLYRPDGKTQMPMEDIPLYRALQGEQIKDVEMMIIPKQSQGRLLLASGQDIRNVDGERQGAVVVMHDITERKQMEMALREREAQLFSIFQTIPDGILILDREGRIIAANPAAEQILRLTRSDITERGYNDPSWAITTADGDPFPDEDLPFVQVMRTGNPVYRVEHAIAHSDGTKIILSINASPLRDDTGEIINVIAAITDVTERKQSETTLRDSEERYRSVIETAAEGIVLQQQDGTIFTCNASAERILGLTAAQMMGRTSLDKRWRTIYEDGSPFPGELHPAMVTLRTGQPQSNVTMGVHKPDGSLTWISINTRPILAPNRPLPSAVVVSFFDITDRKQAEEALQKTEQRYRYVVDNIKEVIFQTDAEGRWTFLNRAWTEITGFSVEESLGQAFLDYVHPGDRQRNLELFQPLIQQEKEYCRHEIRYVTKAGGICWLDVFARLTVDDDGTILGTSGTLNDITERKQVEEERLRVIQEQTARTLAEEAERRSTFLAQVSETLASSLDYEQTLQSVAHLAVPCFADWCSVDLLNEDRTISRVAVAHADPEKVQFGWDMAKRFPRRLDDGYGISEVMKTGRSEIAIAITDEQLVASIPNPEYLSILRGVGLRSCIIAPLQARGRVLGTVSFIFAESERHYSPEDLDLAEDLARRAAIAIDNARLYHMAQQSKHAAEAAVERTTRLQAVTAALSESLTPQQVAEVIVEQSMAALNACAALMVLVTPDRTELEIVKSIGYQEDMVEAWRRFSINMNVPLADAVRTGEPRWIESLAERVARYPHLESIYSRYNFDSWMSLPLVVEGTSIGGMLLSFKDVKQLTQGDRELILALSQQCAQAISRAQLYEAERRARAEAEQANQVKDEFLAVLSHELRSPLNPILGWTRILRTQQLQPLKVNQALETIERNAKLQAQLIEDLLDISRMLRGKLTLNTAPVNLSTVIQDAMETVQLAAAAKSIQIKTLLPAVERPVLGDANRLQQVIWNLLSNAIKFTPVDGQVEVRLEEIEDERVGAWIGEGALPASSALYAQVTVIDTGKGISPDFLPHVFDYFRQADSSTTRNFGGLGLGLAIARQIVELHGGTIQAESAGEGLGASFTVRLPIAIALANSATVQPAFAAEADLSGLHILVVDDEPDMRDLAEFILVQHGARVTVASSAAEAVTAFSQFIPDLLLSDIGMPVMDGYMLIRQIRERSPEAGGTVPAIALTAYAGEVNQQQALQAGFQDHLSKPIEPEALLKAVLSLVSTTRYSN